LGLQRTLRGRSEDEIARISPPLERHPPTYRELMTGENLDDFGFATSYQVERNPAFPAAGTWREPVYTFAREGIHELGRTDAPVGDIALRVTPLAGAPWVGFFSGSVMGVNAVFSLPDPNLLGVVQAGEAWLIDASRPTSSAFVRSAVQSVHRVRGMDAVVFAAYGSMVAVGPRGLLWQSNDLCIDSLQVVEAAAGGIRCTGLVTYDRIGSFRVDPATGQRTDQPG
jgi:hypothetical protein